MGVANVGLAPISPAGPQLSGTGASGPWSALVEPVLETALIPSTALLVPTLGPILNVLGVDMAGADISAIHILKPPPACGTTRLVK